MRDSVSVPQMRQLPHRKYGMSFVHVRNTARCNDDPFEVSMNNWTWIDETEINSHSTLSEVEFQKGR